MESKTKPILSIVAIGLFICFALASVPGESDNTQVVSENCETKPQVFGAVTIYVEYLDSYLDPVTHASVDIIITHQLVNNSDCTFEIVSTDKLHFFTDNQGRASTTTDIYSHSNSADLYRVDVNLGVDKDDEDEIPDWQEVKVAAYNETQLFFLKVAPKPL